MKIQTLFVILACIYLPLLCIAQEKLTIEGAVTLGNSETPSPAAGTLRWTGTEFQGWNGVSWISFTGTGPCDGLNIVKDVEANTYPTVAIDAQCWMAANLRTTLYNDGTSIPNEPAATDWGTLLTPAFCWYNDNSGNANPFGALYNWYAIDPASNGNKNVCPAGWHVPSEIEYSQLVTYLGGENVAGIPAKEAGNVHFIDGNETATNVSGFTAMPGGYRVNTSSYEKGYYAQYWTSTATGPADAVFMDIEYDGEYFSNLIQAKNRGNSVRCIKD